MAITIMTKDEFEEGYFRTSGLTEEVRQQIAHEEGMTLQDVNKRIQQMCDERYKRYVDDQVTSIRSILI